MNQNMLEFTMTEKLTAHQGAVYKLLPLLDRGFFFSGSSDGIIIQWDLKDLSTASVAAKVNGTVLSLCMLNHSSILLVGQLQGGVHVLDLESRKELKHLVLNKDGIFDIQEYKGRIYVAGGDGVISILDMNYRLVGSAKISEKAIRKMDFSGDTLAVGSSDHFIYLLNPNDLSLKRKIIQHANSVFVLKHSPDGLHLLSGSRDAHLCSWDVKADYAIEANIPAHNYTINDIAFHSSKELFATASRDKSIKIWNSKDLSFIKKIDVQSEGHINSVNSIFWNGDMLFSAGDDRAIFLWQMKESI